MSRRPRAPLAVPRRPPGASLAAPGCPRATPWAPLGRSGTLPGRLWGAFGAPRRPWDRFWVDFGGPGTLQDRFCVDFSIDFLNDFVHCRSAFYRKCACSSTRLAPLPMLSLSAAPASNDLGSIWVHRRSLRISPSTKLASHDLERSACIVSPCKRQPQRLADRRNLHRSLWHRSGCIDALTARN